MKFTLIKSLSILLLVAFSCFSTGCKATVTTAGTAKNAPVKKEKVPPGHAKKANGDKSAKAYAPGHN